MTTLLEIHQRLRDMPTIMGIEREIELVGALMKLSDAEIAKHIGTFHGILDDIELAHTDSGCFELTADNDQIFVEFSKWLHAVRSRLGIKINDVIIENFSITAEQFAVAMSKPKI